MPVFPSSGNSAAEAVLRRVMASYWWGKDVAAIAIPPIALNNEAVTVVNAAGTGVVEAFRVNASDQLVFAQTPLGTVTATVTARSGGGQTLATALTSTTNRVSVAAALGDSVRLPASAVGKMTRIDNRGAFPIQVFGAGTDTVNGVATATGVSQGVNTIVDYVCAVAGNWETSSVGADRLGLVALTTNGAIDPHTSSTYVITKAGVYAATLAAPTTTTDDGLVIRIVSDTTNAHTLTSTGLLGTGSAAVNLATFAAFLGAGLTLTAYQGKWLVLSSVGVTFS